MKKTIICLLMTALLLMAGERGLRRDAQAYIRSLFESKTQAPEAVQQEALFERDVQPVTDTLDVTL